MSKQHIVLWLGLSLIFAQFYIGGQFKALFTTFEGTKGPTEGNQVQTAAFGTGTGPPVSVMAKTTQNPPPPKKGKHG